MSKKSFSDIHSDPVLAFGTQNENTAEAINTEKPEEETDSTEHITPMQSAIPKGYKLNPKYIELRNKRLTLLITNSLSAIISKKAKKEKISVNELCNRILIDYLIEK